MRTLNAEDHRLLDIAKLRILRMPSGSTVMGLIRDVNGDLYDGFNLFKGSYTGSVCGEIAALAVATSHLAPKPVEPELAVSLKKAENGNAEVINSCGNCLQRMKDFYADFEIIAGEAGSLVVARVSELLPHGYDQERVRL